MARRFLTRASSALRHAGGARGKPASPIKIASLLYLWLADGGGERVFCAQSRAVTSPGRSKIIGANEIQSPRSKIISGVRVAVAILASAGEKSASTRNGALTPRGHRKNLAAIEARRIACGVRARLLRNFVVASIVSSEADYRAA